MSKEVLRDAMNEEFDRYLKNEGGKYSVNALIELIKLEEELERNELKRGDFELEREMKIEELELSKEQLEFEKHKFELESRNNKKSFYLNLLRTGVEVGGVILPIWFYNCWVNKGLEFEKTGTFTSTTFRNMIGKIKL